MSKRMAFQVEMIPQLLMLKMSVLTWTHFALVSGVCVGTSEIEGWSLRFLCVVHAVSFNHLPYPYSYDLIGWLSKAL